MVQSSLELIAPLRRRREPGVSEEDLRHIKEPENTLRFKTSMVDSVVMTMVAGGDELKDGRGDGQKVDEVHLFFMIRSSRCLLGRSRESGRPSSWFRRLDEARGLPSKRRGDKAMFVREEFLMRE